MTSKSQLEQHVKKFYADNSRTLLETKESLEDIRYLIDDFIDALEADLED